MSSEPKSIVCPVVSSLGYYFLPFALSALWIAYCYYLLTVSQLVLHLLVSLLGYKLNATGQWAPSEESVYYIIATVCVDLYLSIPDNGTHVFVIFILHQCLTSETLFELAAYRIIWVAVLSFFANKVLLTLDLLLLVFRRLLVLHKLPPLDISIELFDSFLFQVLHFCSVFLISNIFVLGSKVLVVTIMVQQKVWQVCLVLRWRWVLVPRGLQARRNHSLLHEFFFKLFVPLL